MDAFDATTAVVILPDGGYGWVIMLASFCANFITDGIVSSCGQFMHSLDEDLDASPASVSLIGALLVGVDQLAGPLASGIANRYGFRKCIIIGTLISAGGFGVSYYATSVEFLYVSYGIVGGIGFGMVYVPAALAVNFWFTRWRALATGIALVGYNAGGVVLPLVLDIAIQQYGWRIAILVEAVLMLMCTLIGLFFRSPPATAVIQQSGGASLTSMGLSLNSRMRVGPYHNKNYISVMELVGPENTGSVYWGPSAPVSTNWGPPSPATVPLPPKGPGCAACCRGLFCCRWRPGCRHLCECLNETFCSSCLGAKRTTTTTGQRPFYRDDIFYDGSTMRLQQYQGDGELGDAMYNLKVTRVASQRDILEEMSKRCVMFPHALRRTLATMCDLSLLRSLPMALQTASCLAATIAFYTPFLFLPARGIAEGLSSLDATFFVTAISAAAAVGRLACAGLASMPCVNHFYLQSLAQLLGGAAVLACGFPIGYEAQLACSAAYGLSFAFTSNLRSIIIVDLVGLQNLTNAFGLVLMFQGVGYIVGPPIAGVILEASDSNYDTVFWFAGGMILLSAAFTLPLNALRKRGKKSDIRR